MKKYTTSRKVTEKSYEGLKPDQARALFLIAESGKDGVTDEQLLGFDVDGNVTTDPALGLKVKQALLFTGSVQVESIAGERKGSERSYVYTGLPISDDLSASLKKIATAVALIGTGTKSAFAEQLVRESQAEVDAAVAAGGEAGEVLTLEKASKMVNGVWLRLQDRGIIKPVKKADLAAQQAAPAQTEAPVDAEAQSETPAE
jgi:hypothetical protein